MLPILFQLLSHTNQILWVFKCNQVHFYCLWNVHLSPIFVPHVPSNACSFACSRKNIEGLKSKLDILLNCVIQTLQCVLWSVFFSSRKYRQLILQTYYEFQYLHDLWWQLTIRIASRLGRHSEGFSSCHWDWHRRWLSLCPPLTRKCMPRW